MIRHRQRDRDRFDPDRELESLCDVGAAEILLQAEDFGSDLFCQGLARRREDFIDPNTLHSVAKLLAVDLVTIAQQIRRRGDVWEGVQIWLGGPVGGGVLSHVEVDEVPAMVSEHDENE